MVKPSIIPEGMRKDDIKEAKWKETSLPAFAVIPLGTDLPPKYGESLDEGGVAPISVINRPRKLGVCLCVSTLLTLLLIIGLAVVLFLGHASGKYKFRCGVGYGDDTPNWNEQGGHEPQGTLEEDVEVDPFEGYEQIEIPEQGVYERLTILHDFIVNMTAYRLQRSMVCYITVLDTAIVMGPSEFIERAEEDPQFLIEHYETVHETYRVVLPELTSLDRYPHRFGYYIPLLCKNVESYWIEKIPEEELEAWQEYWDGQEDEDHESDGRHRRAAEVTDKVKQFQSFAGKLIHTKIFTKAAVQAKEAKDKMAS